MVERTLPGLGRIPEPLLIAEDFAFYQQHLPGVFLLLGTGTGIPLHADTFTFDERVLTSGARRLPAPPPGRLRIWGRVRFSHLAPKRPLGFLCEMAVLVGVRGANRV